MLQEGPKHPDSMWLQACSTDSDEEYSCSVAWSSGPVRGSAEGSSNGPGQAAAQKARQLLQAGSAEQAVQACSQKLRTLEADDSARAALLEARASALLHLGRPAQVLWLTCSRVNRMLVSLTLPEWWLQAKADALQAAALLPSSTSACHVLAEALTSLKDFAGALRECRRGEQLLDSKSDTQDQFVALLDKVATLGALQGSLEGFDGRQLEVRLHAWPAVRPCQLPDCSAKCSDK